jgi:cation-transporting ATPase E
MKDFLVIIRRNFLSPIVIAILVLASILLLLDEKRDAWFISFVIIVNTLLAVVQEIRAQRALKKLELMSAPCARRIRADGAIEEVMFDVLAVGDTIQLQLGDEVPADGEIVTAAGLEVDESILTGESAPIDKAQQSIVYAASAVVAGNATVRVTAVGPDTKVGAMTATLKRYVPHLTPLQQAIGHAITWLTYGALVLAALIFGVYYVSGENAVKIFKTITSAAVTVVPEGLLLASSLLLAFGSIKLAQAKVLPQKLAAIEAMALLNILCVDKTGTLTSDKITFDTLEVFGVSTAPLAELIGIAAKETSSGNTTGDAIITGLLVKYQYKILQTLAFSSARKMSGVKVTYKKQDYSIVLGAPEFLAKLAPLSLAQKHRIKVLSSEGKRVLLAATFKDTAVDLKHLSERSGVAVALVVLSNELRNGVERTITYLQNNGVSLRVISGDNPDTVRYIAEKAGIVKSHKVLTGVELEKVTKKNWDTVVADTTIFARVLPEQKERLIATE